MLAVANKKSSICSSTMKQLTGVMIMEDGVTYEIVHIPDKLPIQPDQQPTVNVLASVIEPKDANAIVRRLNIISPLEKLRHIKRVHKKRLEAGKIKLSVILCLACEDGNKVPNDIVELIDLYHLNTFITKVCKYAASSKEEWQEQCKLWPTSFHPPTYNIDGITGFNEEESKSVSSFMRLTIELAKSGAGHVVNAAVIVDPSVNQVVASARDQTCSCSCSCSCSCPTNTSNGVEHETVHATGSSNKSKQVRTSVSCLNPSQWATRRLQKCSCYWHPLRHATVVAIECSAARDMLFFPGSQQIADNLIDMDHITSSLKKCDAKRQKLTPPNGDDEMEAQGNVHHPGSADRPYLCTGYDIYLLWEPCIMCAMALVHQRIRRIFYAFRNASSGALGSVHRLQGEKSLNHHYAVFRVFVPQQILAG